MPAPLQVSSFPARLARALVGLLLASSVAQSSLLQFDPGVRGAAAANALFLAGVALSFAAHELVQAGVARRLAGRRWAADLASAAAGPLVHLLLTLGVILAARIAYVSGVADPLIRSMAEVATFNIVMTGVNLVPALPMDAGRAVRAAVWGFGGDAERASRIAAAMSEVVALLVLAGGLASALLGELTDAWPFILIGAVIWGHARAERRAAEPAPSAIAAAEPGREAAQGRPPPAASARTQGLSGGAS
jgi:Zn-dependent protease